MTYIPGGKGIATRQSAKPKWFGLKEIERTKDSVVFKTRTGRLYVSTSDVEKYEGVNYGNRTKRPARDLSRYREELQP